MGMGRLPVVLLPIRSISRKLNDDKLWSRTLQTGEFCAILALSEGREANEGENTTMNQQEQQPSPCPECGSQRYRAKKKRIEIDATGTSIHGSVVFCVSCGHTTFYVSNPAEAIANIEKEDRKYQEWLQRQKESAQEQPHTFYLSNLLRKKKRLSG